MDLNIRSHIINNFKDDTKEVIENAINASIEEKDEITLPGMGVFFEILWQDSSVEEREKIIDILKKRLEKGNN